MKSLLPVLLTQRWGGHERLIGCYPFTPVCNHLQAFAHDYFTHKKSTAQSDALIK
jgi:hypothetical protein